MLTCLVAGIISCSLATGPLDPVALRLKYALKLVFDVIFTEKKNDDKNTFEVFWLHFELYCVWSDLWSVCIVNKCSKKDSLFQQNETLVALWFQSLIIALRGYHVYKETAWLDAKVIDKVKTEIETNQSSISIDPYASVVKEKHVFWWLDNR